MTTMTEIVFCVPGPPMGKERPRVVNNNGRSVAYTPQKTRDYENFVKLLFTNKARGIRFVGPIKAEIVAIFAIPKSYTKRQVEEIKSGNDEYQCKPDGDNIIKIILDSLNGLAWKDDAAVYDVHVTKRYGEKPQVIVGLIGKVDKAE